MNAPAVCEVGFEGANQTNVVPSLFGLLMFCMRLGNEATWRTGSGEERHNLPRQYKLHEGDITVPHRTPNICITFISSNKLQLG